MQALRMCLRQNRNCRLRRRIPTKHHRARAPCRIANQQLPNAWIRNAHARLVLDIRAVAVGFGTLVESACLS